MHVGVLKEEAHAQCHALVSVVGRPVTVMISPH